MSAWLSKSACVREQSGPDSLSSGPTRHEGIAVMQPSISTVSKTERRRREQCNFESNARVCVGMGVYGVKLLLMLLLSLQMKALMKALRMELFTGGCVCG